MFQLKIDGQQSQVKLEVSGLSDFGEVMEKLSREILASKSVITQVRLNGKELPAEVQGEYYPLPLEEIETIEIETAHPRHLAYQNLLSATGYLELLSFGLEKVAGLLRAGEDAEANTLYAQCLEGLRWLVRIIDGTRQLLHLFPAEPVPERRPSDDEGKSRDISGCGEGEKGFCSRLASLASQLHGMADEILLAQFDKDWIMLADLLEYQLAPLLKEFKGVLLNLQEEIRFHLALSNGA